MNRNRMAMLREIQELGFRMYDLRLYLDTHPDCNEAVGEYNNDAKKYKAMVEHYENNFGPIKLDGSDYTTPWKWLDGPWPWSNCACGMKEEEN